MRRGTEHGTKKLGAALAVVITLGGCAVTPPVKLPEPSVAATSHESAGTRWLSDETCDALANLALAAGEFDADLVNMDEASPMFGEPRANEINLRAAFVEQSLRGYDPRTGELLEGRQNPVADVVSKHASNATDFSERFWMFLDGKFIEQLSTPQGEAQLKPFNDQANELRVNNEALLSTYCPQS